MDPNGRFENRTRVLCEWETPPPGSCALPDGDAHIWLTSLNLSPALLTQRARLLGSAEEARAGHFHFVRDRKRYIAARSALRLILSRYLSLPPDALRFRYNDFGKPALLDAPFLCFNLSHSGNYALLALKKHQDIGVDIEEIQHDFSWEPVARYFCKDQESDALRALPEQERNAAFYTRWVRMEAQAKALGTGLGSLSPSQKTPLSQIRRAEDTPVRLQDFEIRDFIPVQGYVAAVAAQGRVGRLRFYTNSVSDGEFFLKNAENA